MQPTEALPLPPMELRAWVGPTDEARYDNPSGAVVYPKSAVFYDRGWLERTLEDCGLGVVEIAQRPEARGYQWLFVLGRREDDREILELPLDDGERGIPADLAGSSVAPATE